MWPWPCKLGDKPHAGHTMGPPETSPTRILLVDDDPDLRESLALLLEDEGYLVLVARDGEQALGLQQLHHANVVVSDVMMPVMSGLDLMASLRAANDHSPVLLMSSFASYLDEGRALGAAATLQKPFDIDEFLETVRRAVTQLPPLASTPPLDRNRWEEGRLSAIVRLQLEDWREHPALDDLLEDLRRYLHAPVALFSLVTQTEQRWAVRVGDWSRLSPAARGPREDSFCQHAVEASSPLLVQDARRDTVFQQNPIVCEQGLRFYAGVPVRAYSGLPVGSLCVLGFSPRSFHHVELGVLQVFGKALEGAIEHRAIELLVAKSGSWPGHQPYFDSQWGLLGGAALQELADLHNSRADDEDRRTHCVLIEGGAVPLADLVAAFRKEPGLLVRLEGCRLAWIPQQGSSDDVGALCARLCGGDCRYVIGTFDGRPGSARDLLTSLELELARRRP